MNDVDYDKTKFDADSHGNLSAKTETKPKDLPDYKGYTLDLVMGKVNVWDVSEDFIGDFPDEITAKEHIDSIED